MNERRIARLQGLIKARAAEVIDYELSDPRRGLVTITKVALDRELATCKIFWSVLGTEAQRRTTERMLQSARGYVQREIGKVLHTRTVPRISFVYDESIEGAARMQQILDELEAQRGEVGDEDGAEDRDEASNANDPS